MAAGAVEKRFGQRLKASREAIPRMLEKLGLPAESLDAGSNNHAWMAGESRTAFRKSLFELTQKGVGPVAVGEELAKALTQVGVTPDRLADLIRAAEKPGERSFLSRDFELMNPQEKSAHVQMALGDMMHAYVESDRLKPEHLPEALRDLFANRKEILDWAKQGFGDKVDLTRVPDEYKNPDDRKVDQQDAANKAAERKTRSIKGKIPVDPTGRGPLRILDLYTREDNRPYRITAEESLILNSELEMILVHNREGRLLYKNWGERDKVGFEKGYTDAGNIITHHHPETGSPPSTQDFEMIFKHADCTFRILAKQADGSVIVYEFKANPEKKFSGWKDGEGKTAWEGFYGELTSKHEETCEAGSKTNEAHLQALDLLLKQAGDMIEFRTEVFRQK